MPDRAPLTTYILAALAAILWGANFNLAKPVLTELHPLVAGADRYLIAAAIMLAITCIKGERPPLRHFKAYLILGLLGVFGFNLFFFLGMASTSPVNGALIMALNPLLTSLIARFILGDRPTQRQWLAFPVGLIGVAIVVLGAGRTCMSRTAMPSCSWGICPGRSTTCTCANLSPPIRAA